MSTSLNNEGRYADLLYTNFPANVDTWEDKMDLTSDMIALANQYKTYCEQKNFTAAQSVLDNDSSGLLKRMRIDAMTINEMRHAIMAIERMWVTDIETYVKDQVFLQDLMIGEYTHSYNSSTKTHNFAGSGKNAKVLITTAYTSGDKFSINGVTVNAYMGGAALSNLFTNQYMYFIVGSNNNLYFIGGGDTSSLMPKNGGIFSGKVYFGSNSFWAGSDGDAKFKALITTGNVTCGGALSAASSITASGSVTGAGITSNGNITASGTITGTKVYNAVFNDYAEWFERGEYTEPGDIIALDTSCEYERYVRADESHPCVVGVHSDEYAHIIGGENVADGEDYFTKNIEKFIPVGLAGRVKTKINGCAKVGDMIVPSNIPGVGRAFNANNDDRNSIIGRIVSIENGSGLRFARVLMK